MRYSEAQAEEKQYHNNMRDSFICLPIAIIYLSLGIYGSIELIVRKHDKLTKRTRYGKQEFELVGSPVVVMGVTQILSCVLILLGIIVINIDPYGNLFLLFFGGAFVVHVFRVIQYQTALRDAENAQSLAAYNVAATIDDSSSAIPLADAEFQHLGRLPPSSPSIDTQIDNDSDLR